MLVIRNLSLISVQSWTYLALCSVRVRYTPVVSHRGSDQLRYLFYLFVFLKVNMSRLTMTFQISIIPLLLQSLVIPSKFHTLAKMITLKSLLKSELVMFHLGEWTWFQCISLPFPLYLYATVFLNLCRTSCKEASISHENMVDLRLIAHICTV